MTPLVHVLLGVLIGVSVSVPVGAVAVMTAQRAVHHGFAAALAAGAGATAADSLFAVAAAYGVTAISDQIERHGTVLQILGGALLLIYGWRIVRAAHPVAVGAGRSGRGGINAFASAFALAVTNPGAVLAFAVLFSALGPYAPEEGDHAGALALVAGVALGSLLWWTILAAVIVSHRHRLPGNWLYRVNRWSGFGLAVFGILILAQLVLRLSV